MSKELELAAMDRDSKAAQIQVDLGEALARLYSNRDFKKLVTEGYLREEAVRLVRLKADPAMQAPAMQAAIVRDIDAIGSFGQYLTTVNQRANIGAKQIGQIDDMRAELLAEEDEGN